MEMATLTLDLQYKLLL